MNSKRILVAASLTNGRDAAFERGLALARASGAELYLLHAVPANHAFSVGATHRLERTAELRTRAEQAGVVVRTVEQHGDPAEIIELHANARAVDLIVMGADRTLGRRWLRRTSIAERVLRRTTKPTLIVPTDDDAESNFTNLLVAVDLSPVSKAVVDYAVRFVADVPSAVETRVQLATGSHAKAIVKEADAVNADLVVVGRSGRFRPLGSTALRALRDNKRALLVVPVTAALVMSEIAEQYRRAA